MIQHGEKRVCGKEGKDEIFIKIWWK